MSTSSIRRWRPAFHGLLLVALGIGVFYYVDRRLPYYHFRTVEDGVFYRSSQLSGEDLDEAIDDYGFRTVVNLRTVEERSRGTWYADEQAVTTRRGVKLVDIPLRGDQPPSEEQWLLLYAVFDDPHAGPVLVHCEKGSIRSAAVEGFFRREYLGESGEDALSNVESWSHDLEEEYPEIARFIREYVPRPKAP